MWQGGLSRYGITYEQARTTCGWSYWYYCPHDNPWVQGYSGGRAALCGYAMHDVSRPTKKPLFAEVWEAHEVDGTNCLYNVVYCDSHARTLVLATFRDQVKYLYVTRDGQDGF